MALSQAVTVAILVCFFGSLSFIFGVIAENKKPASGAPIPGKGVVICKFPSDPSVALGALSIISLVITTAIGILAVFFPYKGKKVPRDALFSSTILVVFFTIAVLVTIVAEALMIWATVTEGLSHTLNVHHDLTTTCPTAKTGIFGGAAFLALDAALFWLICQLLTHNARSDYLEEDDANGEYGEVMTSDYDAHDGSRAVA